MLKYFSKIKDEYNSRRELGDYDIKAEKGNKYKT